MKIKNGRIKYPANKVFQSNWGERQNIVVEMDDGSTEKLYFAAGRQPHASLKRGESVRILYENGKRRLVVSDKQNPPNGPSQPQPQYQGLTPDTKRAIANYVQDQANLLGFCLKTASERFSEQVETEDSLRSLATTLFIAFLTLVRYTYLSHNVGDRLIFSSDRQHCQKIDLTFHGIWRKPHQIRVSVPSFFSINWA